MDQNTKACIDEVNSNMEEEEKEDLRMECSNACYALQNVRRYFYGTKVGEDITKMMMTLDEMTKTFTG